MTKKWLDLHRNIHCEPRNTSKSFFLYYVQQKLINFCLSNAMHGHNINLRACMCVCVSVTLSVNSPTGQTPQRIFTVDSLKDADLRKDVPFGVSMMNNHI